MNQRLYGRLVVALVAFVAVPAFANFIQVGGGAGPLPASALDLTGAFPTVIQGVLDGSDPNTVNMFKIDILEPNLFSAFTFFPGVFGVEDPALFLFNSSGAGVYMNDDEDPANAADTQACLPSSAANPCPQALPPGLGPLAPGNYFLAITRSANYPVDASLNEIFSPLNSTDVVGPNGGVGPVAGWDGGAFASPDTDLVNYDIILAGTTPEPATWVMMVGAGLGLLLLRRLVRC